MMKNSSIIYDEEDLPDGGVYSYGVDYMILEELLFSTINLLE